ncbi:S8 family peptidase [Streptomyces sp. DSM 44915]|uniref:S8 family peptidase n=1 Tax=Streptomyces chisholmiae TaxID=3075540 RepID=A0ABU2JUB0_9ACTN|nr:S8 family peptidase [Streptomyces sp. DSM 44915]MDT0268563.1 S8 family peptidase [Streptomyces sp. DSM 44915]
MHTRRLRRTFLTAALAVTSASLLTSHISAHAAEPETGAGALGQARELIVGYRPDSPLATSDEAVQEALATQPAGTTLSFERRLATGAVLLGLGDDPSAESLAAAADQLLADPDVAYAEPNGIAQPHAEPNDPHYGYQWDLFEEAGGMNVPPAWEFATGAGVTVAVVDTGYVTHTDLESQLVHGYDFISDPERARDGDGRDVNYHDPGSWTTDGQCGTDQPGQETTWHGTHVAGTVAAATDNGNGVASTAHGARVQPVRALGVCGGTLADIAEAVVWAAGGSVAGVPDNRTPADVINLSLGAKMPCGPTYQQAVDAAVGRGATVVVSAGNDGANAGDYAPANCANVITVAASGRDGRLAGYSNRGQRIDITAPGGSGPGDVENNILSTYNAGISDPAMESYAWLPGTSMAAPHISALAALLLELRPDLTPAQLERAIASTARPVPGCPDDCGAGLADAGAAVRALAG